MTRRRRGAKGEEREAWREEKPARGAERSGSLTRVLRRRRWLVALGTGLALVLAVLLALRSSLLAAVSLPPPRETPPVPAASRADFVGAERCAGCHAAQYDVWTRSTHGRAGGAPSAGLVIAAFNGAPIRFANARVTPRAAGGVWEFVVEQPGEPARTLRVDGVIGGGHLEGGGTQGFVTRLADGTWRFLPFDWSRHGRFWFCNTISRSEKGWVPITTSLRLEECGDWPPARVLGDVPRFANCQSCHASQLTVTLDTAAHRWDTRFTSLAITCESCHGPGRRHVQVAERGVAARGAIPGYATGADVGLAALATLDKDASLRVCYQCHAVKDRLRDGFLSGDSLEAYYSLKFPLLGDRPLLPDGRVRTFAYQEAHQYSDCYLNGGLTCTSCHDPHSQRYRDVNGAALSGRFDDAQCTACHASKADRVAQHSHHAVGSAGSRCVACHMPYRQQPQTTDERRRTTDDRRPSTAAVRYARSDHSIAIPRPAFDGALGVTSACATCHANRSTSELEQAVRAWWGELKLLKPMIAAQARFSPSLPPAEASPLLLGDAADTAGDRHAFARFAGVSRWLETYVTPGGDALDARAEARLTRLARHPDEDVRAVALAALHLAKGDDRGVRRTLARALREAGAHDAGLRARWSLALGYLGDRFASAGDLTAAVAAYTRALEVTPADARVLLNLGHAQRGAGDPATAVATYRRSLAADARQPLAWVNLGIAAGAAGDTAGAIAALERAGALDASEPLAWFNLGNIALVRGQLDRAKELYARAAALDPGLALAHFQLARVSLLEHDAPAALRALRRGLAFDSSDAAARRLAENLGKMLGVRQ